MKDVEAAQVATAARFSAQVLLPRAGAKVGISRNVRNGVEPLNALRHPVDGASSGWFIWGGTELSDDRDFFEPLHISHVATWCPAMVPYLGLPPGWRVLLASEYEDVWFDEGLLTVERTEVSCDE